MTLRIAYGTGVFALPADMTHYLDKADPLTLRLFLLLASDPALREHFDSAAVAKSFAVKIEEVEKALAFWENAGLLLKNGEGDSAHTPKAGDTVVPKKVTVSEKIAENGEKVTVVTSGGMPHYTGSEIEAIMNADSTMALLIEECQKIAGKMFGAHEINRVLGMADYLRLDHDAILLLFDYTKRIDKCSVAYIEKMAVSLVNEGASDYASIEAYITKAEKKHTLEGLVRRLAGLSARAFSAKEKKFVEKWSELAISEELIEMAYDVTVNNTGSFAFPYMNKVLLNWREAGYTTAKEVEAAAAAYRNKKEQGNSTASFDIDEFFEAALKRSYERIDSDAKAN